MDQRQGGAPLEEAGSDPCAAGRHPPSHVFLIFLKLGLTSFGGPIAHLGYFRETFVAERKWFDDRTYADIVALCQFLPGPASSQTGMAIGFRAAGHAGALAAFLGFTLPSAIIMLLAGLGVGLLDGSLAGSVVQGLKIVAVAVVAHAVWTMARSLCPNRARASFALAAALWMLLVPSAFSQVLVIVAGGVAGYALLRAEGDGETSLQRPLTSAGRSQVQVGLGLFAAILLLAPLLAWLSDSQTIAVFAAFYRTGSLVFGGGHVVLPLLEREVVDPGWVSPDTFLAGYGIAQALPGPLFTFSAFLGAASTAPPNGMAGAALALFAIFLPAFLLVYGALPLWDRLRRNPELRTALMGTNAAVVGLLLAALYDPVFTSAIRSPRDFALALLAFGLLSIWRVSPLHVVLVTALGGLLLPLLAQA